MTKIKHNTGNQKRSGGERGISVFSEDPRASLLAEIPVSERTIRLNGISTAVLEGGDGPPIILLHGPGEYAAKWLRVIPDLVKTHRVIAPDLPGHGNSEPVDGRLDVDFTLAWLEDLIESTCETPPVLVGQILGGAIAARFAGRYQERIDSLVLADTLGLVQFQPTPEFGKALNEFMTNPTEDTHDNFWSYCAYDLETLRDGLGERWDWIKTYNLDRAQSRELAATQQALMETFGLPAVPSKELEAISVPTTLIWGRHDLASSLSVAQSASTKYGWPLHVIENAADDPPLEQPDSFLVALRTTFGK